MQIEIITTGEELLSGATIDTNSAWIAERCKKYGHRVNKMTTVGDKIDAIASALLSVKADCAIISGGLGPTSDDLTILAASKAFDLPLEEHAESRKRIEKYFAGRGVEFAKTNLKQAMLPKNSAAMPNDLGTAPGVRLRFNDCEYFFLPGVPRELYPMFERSIEPFLSSDADKSTVDVTLTCFGLPEANIANIVEGLNLKGVEVGYRVRFPYVEVKLRGKPGDADSARQTISAALKSNVVGVGSVVLAGALQNLFVAKGLKFACAESCTGGLLANLVTDEPGASSWFDRGVVTYSNESKEKILGVSRKTIESHGAVSEETAREMATGLLNISAADVCLSLTGIAGPTGGTDKKPVGTLCIGLATKRSVKSFTHHLVGYDRIRFKQYAAALALNAVREIFLNPEML